MKYLGKSFSSPANSKEFVDNWDAVFGEKKTEPDDAKPEQPDCTARESNPPASDR